ncbi:MAG: shikimate kinase [Archangium sp.]
MTLLDDVDPRLQPVLRAEWNRRRNELTEGLPCDVTVVLAGHRSAGKSRLLPKVAKALGRSAVDLDLELEHRHGRPIREWFATDARDFRIAERDTFRSLPSGLVVAVGGGFLSHHPDALRGCVVVEVPISFETYAERLRADTTRPRLKPELSIEEELREVYSEREFKHAAAKPLSLIDFMLKLVRGRRPRRVVTLPPETPVEPFAWAARHAGADLLEVRSDLHPRELDLLDASRALPLLLARRTEAPLPDDWLARASLRDEPQQKDLEPSVLRSLHAEKPLTTAEALAQWDGVVPGSRVKHVEPLGAPSDFPRLLATQKALIERFGAEHVTVLATGPFALPFRAVLAQRNALDYLALERTWAAAVGQRLLADAVRESRRALMDGSTRRLGIFGSAVAHSRSPRIHQQPFDRIELPETAPLAELLRALSPHYRGFAVTNPFKKPAARAVGSERTAVNTLIRNNTAWSSENTDVDGARVVLEKLDAPTVTVLGDGGVTVALREAAVDTRTRLEVRTRASFTTQNAVTGAVVWSWPAHIAAPNGLRFENARVAVVAYGAPARTIATRIRELGGEPLMLGARWFIAQARRQRQLWESAT